MLGYGNALRDDALAALGRVRDQAGVPDARVVTVPDSSPARALHHLAETEHADLLVVGSAHHGTLGRIVLGDVSRAILHGAPCPVAVAPLGFAAGPPATVGVACDNGPEARAAVKVAADLAAAAGARLLVRDAVESNLWPAMSPYPVAIDLEAVLQDERIYAQKRLDDTCAGLPREVETSVVTGPTTATLDAFAREVDLLVCGSRGWGPIRRVLLGSTADHLIHHAACPVLVVPRAAAVAQPAAPAEASEATVPA